MKSSSPTRSPNLAGLIVVLLMPLALAQEKAPEANYAVLHAAQLEAVIGDNGAFANHRSGYNGVFNLKGSDTSNSAFVDDYAGLNLEHYFDGSARAEDGEIFFEPRHAPMNFERIDDRIIELHQPQTPHYGVESWSRFEAKDPYYIDLAFRCIPHKPALSGGFLGVFWASYMNEPEDKSIYFLKEGSSLDAPEWVQLCTQQHGLHSTVRPAGESAELSFEEPGDLLYANLSTLRYAAPFFYGRVKDFVVIFLFKPGPDAELRFAHSPTGGGNTKDETATNPAWDFQLIVPGYEAGKEYTLDARLVYKPWKDREDVLAEARKYLEE